MNDPLGVYVDLDSLLDTRLPIVYFIDKDMASSIVENKTYFNRIYDEFDKLPHCVFKELYNRRNKAIFNLATPTNILNKIKDHILSIYLLSELELKPDFINLYVNTYPYKLTMIEIENIRVSFEKVLPKTKVVPIYVDDKDLTAEWCNKNLSLIIKYNGLEWLEYITSTQQHFKHSLLDITMFVPSLFLAPNYELTNDADISNAFNKVENFFKQFINLKVIPTKEFCLI